MRESILGCEYEVAGELAQAAVDAAQKKLEKIANKTGDEAAFWGFRVTLDFVHLADKYSKISQKIRVTEILNWNYPEKQELNS
jgi:hypothetical protein